MEKREKTGGRQKGTPNKLTASLRERISFFLEQSWSLVEADFMALPPSQRIVFYEKLLQYSLPKLMPHNIGEETLLQAKLEGLSEAEIDKLITKIKEAANE